MSLNKTGSFILVDGTLKSLEGHSYNYDLAVARAAVAVYQNVTIYADKRLPSYINPTIPIHRTLNNIPFDWLKQFANRFFEIVSFFTEKSSGLRSGNASVHSGVPSVFLRYGEYMRAIDFRKSLQLILVAKDELQCDFFIQHARIGEIFAVETIKTHHRFHLVLRHSPELICNSVEDIVVFASRLRRISRDNRRHIFFYTDSALLTEEYQVLTGELFPALPIPILLTAEFVRVGRNNKIPRLSVLGGPRIEKGFDHLPEIIASLPEGISLAIQISRDTNDSRVIARTKWLDDVACHDSRLTLLEGPVAESVYFEWFAKTDILLLPYISPKYASSTSGVFVEALYFSSPIIAIQGTWMAGLIEKAADEGLRIGMVIDSFAQIRDSVRQILDALPLFHMDMKTYFARWQQSNNAENIITILKAR